MSKTRMMRTWVNGEPYDDMWRVHTPLVIKEMIEGYPGPCPWIGPAKVMQNILIELAELAQEIDDPRLHRMMCRLTLYSVVETSSPDYDKDICDKLRQEIEEMDASPRFRVLDKSVDMYTCDEDYPYPELQFTIDASGTLHVYNTYVNEVVHAGEDMYVVE